MTTPRPDQPFDLGAALNDIAAEAGATPGAPAFAAQARAAAARRRRRHRTLVTLTTAAVLAVGAAGALAVPRLVPDPGPAVSPTPTPTPSTPTPTPTPEPTPEVPGPTDLPTEPEGPAVPDGYTTDRVELPVVEPGRFVFSCGQALPTKTGAERLVTATVPVPTVTLRTGEDWADVPVEYSVPSTVKVEGLAGMATAQVASGGVIVSNLGLVPDGDIARFNRTPGEHVNQADQGVVRDQGCNTSVMDDMYEGVPLAPGTYQVAFLIDLSIDGYALQQQDGTWGAWQSTPGTHGGGVTVYLVTNSFTLVVK